MADESVNLNTIVQEQSKTIQTLTDQIAKQRASNGVTAPIYNTTPAPAVATAPNYMLYGLIGLGVYFIFKKLRRG